MGKKKKTTVHEHAENNADPSVTGVSLNMRHKAKPICTRSGHPIEFSVHYVEQPLKIANPLPSRIRGQFEGTEC